VERGLVPPPLFLLNLCQKDERESDCWVKGTGIKALYTEIMQLVRREMWLHMHTQVLVLHRF
jgi:hypothetical protein